MPKLGSFEANSGRGPCRNTVAGALSAPRNHSSYRVKIVSLYIGAFVIPDEKGKERACERTRVNWGKNKPRD